MHWLERLLLYGVALILAVLLIQDREPNPSEPTASASRGIEREPLTNQQTRDSQANVRTGGGESQDFKTRSGLTIFDDAGRPRIELGADVAGPARIVMLDRTGDAVLTLRSENDGVGSLVIGAAERRIQLQTREDGAVVIELNGASDTRASVRLDASGGTEVVVGGGPHGMQVVLRTSQEGTAEVGLHRIGRSGGPMLWLNNTGEATVSISGEDGEAGPVMQFFPDGLSQVALLGAHGQDGPAMIRTPEGLAIISVRRDDGEPAASMVASPDGDSVVAATSRDGTQQAALRVSADGRASVFVSDPAATEPPASPNPTPPAEAEVLSVSPGL